MTRHVYVLAGLTALVFVAALVSPGHAMMLALGLGAGPFLARYLSRRAAAPQVLGAAPVPVAGTEASVFDAIALPVIVLDPRTNVRDANAASRATFPGLAPGNPLSFTLRDPALIEAVTATLADGVQRTVELIERVPVDRAFACIVSPLPPARGGMSDGVAVLLRETSKERAVEAMRVDFVANASHELRTPLASVLGLVETLQGAARNDPVAREKFLAIMHQQAQRMARLVDDLLSLSRIELKEHIAPDGVVDLAKVVADAALALSELAREKGVTLGVEQLSADARVIGDRDELASVLDNLVENAIKYGKAGGKVDIAIADAANGRDISVAVRDYGPGIAAQYLPRLTERFYRIDSALSRAEGGTGLGLALVKHTINRHRGRLTIDSAPGNGSTFTILIPRAPPPLAVTKP